MRDRLIGFDSGGTMTKVALFDLDGEELACEHRPNGLSTPKPGWTERDPDATWRACADAIAALLERTGTKPGQVAALAPSGFGAGLFFAGPQGEVVRPGLVSTDSRAATTVAGWRARGLTQGVEAQTGSMVWPGQSLAILGWMAEHEPEAMARTAHFLACKDFLRLRLTGEVSTDPTDAGCAGLLDIATGAYAVEALEALGLGAVAAKLPAVGRPDEVAGRVSAEAARLTGLAEGTPVARGVYDVIGCSLASGVTAPDMMGMVAGTFSINSTLHEAACRDPLPTLQSPYPLGGTIATIATPTSASNLEWLCKTLLAAEAERCAREGRSIYQRCSELVEGSLDRESGAIFLPYLFGGPDGAPAGLVGVTAADGAGDVMRAVFEGIVFAQRADVETLLGGRDSAAVSLVRFAGGPSKSAVWSQMFADALGRPLEIANGSEFGAKGGAMCAAVAVGAQPDLTTAIGRMVRIARRYAPRPDRAAALEARYRRHRAVSARLGAAWAAE